MNALACDAMALVRALHARELRAEVHNAARLLPPSCASTSPRRDAVFRIARRVPSIRDLHRDPHAPHRTDLRARVPRYKRTSRSTRIRDRDCHRGERANAVTPSPRPICSPTSCPSHRGARACARRRAMIRIPRRRRARAPESPAPSGDSPAVYATPPTHRAAVASWNRARADLYEVQPPNAPRARSPRPLHHLPDHRTVTCPAA